MANQPETFETIESLAWNIKTKLGTAATKKKVVAIYAFNATGKTRLSNLLSGSDENGELLLTEDCSALETENGDEIELENWKIKKLCYNAFLEDIFIWDNENFILKFNLNSWFIGIIKWQWLDIRIVENFTDIVNQNGLKLEPNINFKEWEKDEDWNDIQEWEISFKIASWDNESTDNVKISKGEEGIFIWSVYYTILEAAISELILKEENRTTNIFNDLEYIIIDDPVSSIDDTRIITLAVKLIDLIKNDHIKKHLEKIKNELEKQEFTPEYIKNRLDEIRSENYSELKVKFLLTTHHALYYNVLVNSFRLEARSKQFLSFSLSRDNHILKLVSQWDSPFSYHLAVKELIQKVINDDIIEKYHFNLLRALFEKTANFLGYENWYDCIVWDNKQESTRLLNIYSHSRLSDLENNELSSRDKELFIETFNEFLEKFKYNQ
jgi:hypothetical protein